MANVDIIQIKTIPYIVTGVKQELVMILIQGYVDQNINILVNTKIKQKLVKKINVIIMVTPVLNVKKGHTIQTITL